MQNLKQSNTRKKKFLFGLLIFAFVIAGVRASTIYNKNPAQISITADQTETAGKLPFSTIDSENTAGPLAIYNPSSDADLISENLSPDIELSQSCKNDLFGCKLMKEIAKTHRFLQRNEKGLPYADDQRNLTPLSEKIRLVIDTQAHGYLNLYKITGKKKFLREAESRLDFMLSNNETYASIMQKTPFNGQVGYTFLSAYQLDSKAQYLESGLSIASMCINITESDKIMNWGLMCGMDLAKAYEITGISKYLSESRKFVRNTMIKQNGGFPHFKEPNSNIDSSYTSWMTYELNQIRIAEPRNPDIENSLISANSFLRQRVNEDGSLSPISAIDTIGWNSDLPSYVYNLRVLGENEKAAKVLNFLFLQENKNNLSGSYPDKWGYFEPNSTWANSNSSIVRTSLIFWMLTSIPFIDNSCVNGQASACTISPADCNSAFSELNLCNSGISGTNTCINGRLTGCLNSSVISYATQSFECSIWRDECADIYHFDGYKKQVLTSYSSCFYGDCTPSPSDHEYRCDQQVLCTCHPDQCQQNQQIIPSQKTTAKPIRIVA